MQAERTAPSREYQLVKIGPGDYILPGNSGLTLWRLEKAEDGVSYGLVGVTTDWVVWRVWKFRGLVSAIEGMGLDVTDWNEWDLWDGSPRSRQEAIEVALRGDVRP